MKRFLRYFLTLCIAALFLSNCSDISENGDEHDDSGNGYNSNVHMCPGGVCGGDPSLLKNKEEEESCTFLHTLADSFIQSHLFLQDHQKNFYINAAIDFFTQNNKDYFNFSLYNKAGTENFKLLKESLDKAYTNHSTTSLYDPNKQCYDLFQAADSKNLDEELKKYAFEASHEFASLVVLNALFTMSDGGYSSISVKNLQDDLPEEKVYQTGIKFFERGDFFYKGGYNPSYYKIVSTHPDTASPYYFTSGRMRQKIFINKSDMRNLKILKVCPHTEHDEHEHEHETLEGDTDHENALENESYQCQSVLNMSYFEFLEKTRSDKPIIRKFIVQRISIDHPSSKGRSLTDLKRQILYWPLKELNDNFSHAYPYPILDFTKNKPRDPFTPSFTVVKLKKFSSESFDDLTQTLSSLKNDKDIPLNNKRYDTEAKNLVIDLRNNGGGDINQADRILEYLLPEESLTSYVGATFIDDEDQKNILNKKPNAQFFNFNHKKFALIPSTTKLDKRKHYFDLATRIIVLVNRYTASASEIVASALKEHGAAIIVGEKTYGKGIGQSVRSLISEKHATNIIMTNTYFFTPKGQSNFLKPNFLDIEINVNYSEQRPNFTMKQSLNLFDKKTHILPYPPFETQFEKSDHAKVDNELIQHLKQDFTKPESCKATAQSPNQDCLLDASEQLFKQWAKYDAQEQIRLAKEKVEKYSVE